MFVYTRCRFFIKHVICEHFSPFCGWFFFPLFWWYCLSPKVSNFWYHLIYPFLSFVMCVFGVTFWKPFFNSSPGRFTTKFLSDYFIVLLLHLVPFWVNVSTKHEVRVQSYSFICSYLLAPVPFVEMTIHSSLDLSWHFHHISVNHVRTS